MLQKLRNDSKGFTLIELMIVIAIIGILAAIAIPNFIAYRNKAYCSRAESDGNNIAAAIADYYAIPTHVTLLDKTDVTVSTSPLNTWSLSGTVDAIVITVTDGSGRCPTDYRQSNSLEWSTAAGNGVYTKSMQ